MSERTIFRTCPLCEATCGLAVTVRDDEVVRVAGDPDDVFSRGFLCAKGATLKDLHHDPDRLRRPLIRRDGRHVEASWEEAYAEIAKRLPPIVAEHGRDALGVYLGNPNVHNLAGAFAVKPLLKTLGSRNIFSASTCDQMPKHVSSAWLFGHPDRIPVPDLDRTDYLLMLGANPWHSNGSLCTAPDFPGRIKAIRARGGKVVLVDPRRSRTAREVDEHLAIRPGTDPDLLLAILYVLFDEDLVDLGALASHVQDVDALREACRAFTPEAAQRTTDIDADTIRRLAREIAAAPTAIAYGRIGTHTAEFGTLASWAVDAINVLTGNLDRPGGAMFPRAAHGRRHAGGPGKGFQIGRWTSRVRGLPEVRGEMPTATMIDEMETEGPGQIRALLTVAGNPALSTPAGGRLAAALEKLDFMVSVDLYLNETSRHADVILPPTSPLERGHYDMAFYGLAVRNVAKYSPPVFEVDAPDEIEILTRLTMLAAGRDPLADPNPAYAFALGSLIEREVKSPASPIAGRDPREIFAAIENDAAPHWGPAEHGIDFLLRVGPYGDGFGADPDGWSLSKLEKHPHGVDFGPLKAQIPDVLTTPSGKIELAPELILRDIERRAARLEAPREEGLLLVGRRHVRSNNSWMHNVGVLVRGKDRCTLHVHPDDAERLGLSDGAAAHVASREGALPSVPVEITEDIRPGVVSLPHGWGHDQEGTRLATAEAHAGVNSNVLTDPAPIDPLSGNAVLNAIPVDVRPA